jgi:hypothetical protein
VEEAGGWGGRSKIKGMEVGRDKREERVVRMEELAWRRDDVR